MPTFILIAFILTGNTGFNSTRPVAITVEFSGLVQCETARKNLYGQQRIDVIYSACERK